MKANEIRQKFFDFFSSKEHGIVLSAPMVVKGDPTLMFTNAGMNQFKEIFLGHAEPKQLRLANSQKCLRVSGKHNDLEEVGHDTYHHTMFEMLGNWSFGDYFKKEAISWAWEFLHKEMGLPADRMYATVFEGHKEDGLESDEEAREMWKTFLPADHVLNGSKKDNFWEMGESGPCGPCSELHFDLREDAEREKIPGAELVNKDHPLVIEIWNLVFIQFNRKADGKLENLPQKHVDTGMGFERLCMVLQNKKSNYDTDVFQPLISELADSSNVKYGEKEETDIALRVISDHLRAVAFAIADGQLPSNNKAGYVIRRILRRAVRYGYTFLGKREPFIYKLFGSLATSMGKAYPELEAQDTLIAKVIKEEENAFLRTLETGIQKFEKYLKEHKSEKVIDGKFAFELFDTFGFPLDLTMLMAREKDHEVDLEGFDKCLAQQKERSRKDAAVEAGDWITLIEDEKEEFIGYDHLKAHVKITKYRVVKVKGKEQVQLVFNYTPFYAESGGQVGDTGFIEADGKKFSIIDTQKENNVSIHIAKEMPSDLSAEFTAFVNAGKRESTARNHTATHLLHESLREVLGDHIEQKGSYVDCERLRFDFSHFQKLSDEEIQLVERKVNDKIRSNIALEEKKNIPMDEAQELGAVALFGEKYGDLVRVIRFGSSTELCGGTHVPATGTIGLFKIVSESAIAAGIRRIEAISGLKAEDMVSEQQKLIENLKLILKNPKDPIKGAESLIRQNQQLQKKVEQLSAKQVNAMLKDVLRDAKPLGDVDVLARVFDLDAQAAKDLAFRAAKENAKLVFVLAYQDNGKAGLTVILGEDAQKIKALNAGKMIRELAKEIKGGGGGQAHFATAGGKDPGGLQSAVDKVIPLVEELQK